MISIGTQISWKYTTGGWSLNVDGANPLTLNSMSLSKPNVEFNDEQLKIYAKHTIDYLASINDFKKRVEVKNVIDNTDSFSLNDFSYVKPKYLYKYINEKSVDYYKKGQFQVGSIGYFKKMENEKARDELEGLLFIAIQTGNRIANFSLNMGSNFYAFCGTQQDSDSLNDYHRKNFGSILLKIEAEPFAAKIAKQIGAKSFKIMNVNYANAKLLRTKVAFQTQIESFSSLVSSDMLNLMMHIVNECTFPCLSLKSGWFTEETETRILFEMPYDVNQNIPKRFEHQGLLKYIEFL